MEGSDGTEGAIWDEWLGWGPWVQMLVRRGWDGGFEGREGGFELGEGGCVD